MYGDVMFQKVTILIFLVVFLGIFHLFFQVYMLDCSKQQKNKLKTMSLNELVNTIDDITNHQYAEDIEVIKECLASGFKTTKFVMKHMEEQKKQLDQYKVEKVNDTDFVVSGMYGSNNLQRTVVINDSFVQECFTCARIYLSRDV